MKSGQHTRGHGGEGREEFPRTRSAWEQLEEEIGGDLLRFFLAAERERGRKGMGEVDEPFPPCPFTHPKNPRAVVPVQGSVV
jgi:hypothetical protein